MAKKKRQTDTDSISKTPKAHETTKDLDYTLRKIENKKQQFQKQKLDDNLLRSINDYWVKTISDTLFHHWAGTPWDFNGTAKHPGVAPVACGYFVTVILQNMGMNINRVKLSTCASSEMMKQLVPNRKIINLTSSSHEELHKKFKALPIGVYIIGLSQHTGFIVRKNDEECFFIHSNYIGRKGVVKENIEKSTALHHSTIHWIMPISSEKEFIQRWING